MNKEIKKMYLNFFNFFFNYLGVIYQNQENFDQALKYFRKVIEFDPKF